jgi:hypothetical protein
MRRRRNFIWKFGRMIVQNTINSAIILIRSSPIWRGINMNPQLAHQSYHPGQLITVNQTLQQTSQDHFVQDTLGAERHLISLATKYSGISIVVLLPGLHIACLPAYSVWKVSVDVTSNKYLVKYIQSNDLTVFQSIEISQSVAVPVTQILCQQLANWWVGISIPTKIIAHIPRPTIGGCSSPISRPEMVKLYYVPLLQTG